MLISNIISSSPVIFYASALFGYLITSSDKNYETRFFHETYKINIFLLFIIGFIIFYSILNPISKKLFEYIFKNTSYNYLLERPNPPIHGCGLYPDLKLRGSSSYGFPSGHSQACAFFATFWTMYLLKVNNININTYIRITSLWIMAGCIFYQRIATGCHNLLQVVGGASIGIVSATIFFKNFL